MNGMIWFILSGMISVCNDVLTKLLGAILSGSNILFFRLLISLITIIPFWLYNMTFSLKIVFLNLLRSILLFIGMLQWAYGTIALPLSITTTIGFTTPISSTILASLLLKEYFSRKHMIANIIGFIGVIFMTLNDDLSINYINLHSILYLMSATICFVLLDILNKKMLLQHESIISMMFYSSFFTLIISSIFTIDPINITNIQTYSIILLFMLGIGANLILFCLLKAFELSSISRLQPLKYLELVTAMILSIIIFNEYITIMNIIGAFIIIATAMYSASQTKQF